MPGRISASDSSGQTRRAGELGFSLVTCDFCHSFQLSPNPTLPIMSDLSLPEPMGGFPEPAPDNCLLAATLLRSLKTIQIECELMHREALHYPLTKHIHAIRDSVMQMVMEITGRDCPLV